MQKDFSYPLHIADLNQQEQHYHLVADAEQCKTLAQILQIGITLTRIMNFADCGC